MPFGPKVLFTASAITLAAMMFACWASFPLYLEEPSFKIKTGTPCVAAINIPHQTIVTLRKFSENIYFSYSNRKIPRKNFLLRKFRKKLLC
jgi:hypothetical protein